MCVIFVPNFYPISINVSVKCQITLLYLTSTHLTSPVISHISFCSSIDCVGRIPFMYLVPSSLKASLQSDDDQKLCQHHFSPKVCNYCSQPLFDSVFFISLSILLSVIGCRCCCDCLSSHSLWNNNSANNTATGIIKDCGFVTNIKAMFDILTKMLTMPKSHAYSVLPILKFNCSRKKC